MSIRINRLRAGIASLAATGLAVAGAGIASATTIAPPVEGVTVTGAGAPALTLTAPGYVMDCHTFEAKGVTPVGGNVVTPLRVTW